MMKRYNQWILAAMFTLCGTMMLTSCSSSDDEGIQSIEKDVVKEYTRVEPTTDQLAVRVTEDLPAASLSQFADKSAGAALIKRLPKVTASITNDTEFVLIKASDISSQSDAVMAQMANVLAMGGYIAIERPTDSQLDNFMDKIENAIAAVVKDCVDDLFELTPEQTQATVRASMAGRMAMRRANLSKYTRAAADDEVCAELIIYGPYDYYFEDPLDTYVRVDAFFTDTDGNLLEDIADSKNTWEPTEYHYGLIADGAAEWINDIEASYDDEEVWYSIEGNTSRRVSRRASGMTAINDIMNATESFSRSGKMCFRNLTNETMCRPNRVMMTIRTWGVHNIGNKKDFYYVNENVLLRMGMSNGFDPFVCRDYKLDDWINETKTENGKTVNTGNRWYGNFLTQYEASMDLSGDGTITCEAATPETANEATTQTVNAAESMSTSNTVTFSTSTTAGWTGGVLGFSRTLNYNNTTAITNGNSFAMTNSKSIKDLNVVKNTTGTKVTWTYKGKCPKASGVGNNMHEQPAAILVNDANLVNDACWSVTNPKGQYTLKIGSFPVTGVLMVDARGEAKIQNMKTESDNNWDITLLQPSRVINTWRMFTVVNEWQDGFKQGAQAELVATISKKFPDLYKNVFQVGELSENSVKNASSAIMYTKKVFDVYKDILQAIAKSYGIKKFTITWSSDKNLQTKEGYVVTVD